MEHEEKRCPVCRRVIPVDSKATYCSRTCVNFAYFRRHSKIKRSEECLCLFNGEVLCSDKECENCGWNPEVEKRRKEALA